MWCEFIIKQKKTIFFLKEFLSFEQKIDYSLTENSRKNENDFYVGWGPY